MRAGWAKDRYVVHLDLHPAAPAVVITLEPDGELIVAGETWRVGPGYHLAAIDRIAKVLDELEYGWTDEIDRARVPLEMATWPAEQLRGGKRVLGLDHAFRIDAAVLTPLGPRDAAWRDAVIADPMRAADAFAWWKPETPAAYSRALLAMWHVVAWREPLDK